jgi:RNA polymerase sigma-70 factor (ECF subfamily)
MAFQTVIINIKNGGIILDIIEDAVDKVKNGYKNSFEIIIEKYQKPLFCYCFHILGNTIEAEDAVQEIFLKIFEKIDYYKPLTNFSSWIYKISYNHCMNYLTRKKLFSFIPFIDDKLNDALKTEMIIDQDDYGLELNSALKKLNVVDRTVIILRCLEDRSYEEIAAITGLSCATVRKKYERSRKKLKLLLDINKDGIAHETY